MTVALKVSGMAVDVHSTFGLGSWNEGGAASWDAAAVIREFLRLSAVHLCPSPEELIARSRGAVAPTPPEASVGL